MSLQIKDSRFVKVWKIKETEYGKRFDLGTSRKDQEGNYIKTNWFGCRLVGKAKVLGDGIREGDLIKIVSGVLDNVYNKEKKVTYMNRTIFEAELEGDYKKVEVVKTPVAKMIENGEIKVL